jgi:hypothetical protein
MSRYQHPSYAGGLTPVPEQLPLATPITASTADAGRTALARADRACCCPAQPAVIVVMPPAPGERPRSELLLCMHHYRISRRKLAASGATVLDRNGGVRTDADLW